MAGYSATQRTGSWRQLLLVGTTVLAVGLATGVGVWQVGLHDQRGRSASLGQRSAQPHGSQATGLLATGSLADTAAAAGAVQPAQAPRLIVVDSAVQAPSIQQDLAVLDATRYLAGLPPLNMTVQQVADDAEETTVRQTVAHENELLAGAGLPAIQLVDLRAGVEQPVHGQAAIAESTEATVIYLVSSDDQENFFREAATTLAAPPEPRDQFVIVSTDTDVTAIEQQVGSENAIFAANGLPPIQVHDLR